ncbi:uncharacterized protein METZ01_LOCUS363989, partial [marine metagenome]
MNRVDGTNLNQAEAGVYRFESKTPGELTLIHTLSGEKQTVAVPTNVGQGTSINFSELGVQVELNNRYDGSVVIGQETVDQAQNTLSPANTNLANREADVTVKEGTLTIAQQTKQELEQKVGTATIDRDNAITSRNDAKDVRDAAQTSLNQAK